ncbi:hypothetical protein FUA26_09995 [Seonamhaeicola algicola]|uniref:Lipoprotein n=1 Tax=Seonamhaeicola algicola TaxID=1719036 RepID=A0A5C7AM57_9FLAO|nr:hypothetical protein [Seonamhaeicola algicola]TXE09810.1 hypothetical protein FUA26_09995 [Seonamhaeicola algicola]
MQRPTLLFSLFFNSWLLLSITACASKNIEPPTLTKNGKPKLLFINFNITQTNNGKHISLINKIETEGAPKQNTLLNNGTQGDLLCNLLNKKGRTLKQFSIKNPLKKHMEYINDNKQLQTQHVQLTKTSFTLRFPAYTNVHYLSIFEIDTLNKKSKPLITTTTN